jgi:tRNA G37 N-methylase Trm5
LKEAQKVKAFLVEKGFFDQGYHFSKTCCDICFPVKNASKDAIKEKFGFVSFSERDVERSRKTTTLKKTLSAKLSDDEMAVLQSAFDVIGNIAIIEIPEKLVRREKQIADALLRTNRNITTVLKKAGIHGTEFRTQKMKWLAGEKTKETLHRELGIMLKLDVENVYFSPRLSSERKRIAGLVKPGEDILVMFSGCAPYPCVLSKHTQARNITGIELNPVGHMYGMENLKLNRVHNVTLINGDVNKVVPDIYHYIVGMKSADKEGELKTRLIHHPVIMELHLFDDDLWKGLPKLERTIQQLQKKGIHVVLHMPFRHEGKRYSLGQADIRAEMRMFRALGALCKKHHVKAVVHPTQDIGIAEDEKVLVTHLKLLEQYYDYFCFENVTHGLFAKAKDIVRIGRKAGIRNMCIDLCHLYIMYQDNDMIERHVKNVQKHFNTYFHLNDHDCRTHSCEIGKGFVDVKRILPYVSLGVTEVCDRDELHPKEMVRSYLDVEHTTRKFDRIIMPLPTSAAEFLDAALKVSKKGTMIHFYDFKGMDNIKESHEKILAACKKNKKRCKILRTVKCGQHAPWVFRICVDFRVL